jgi:hypothetical protein
MNSRLRFSAFSLLLLAVAYPTSALPQATKPAKAVATKAVAHGPSLPDPTKLCALLIAPYIARSENEETKKLGKWQFAETEYSCDSVEHIMPRGPDVIGAPVYMIEYSSAGAKKERATRLYFNVDIFGTIKKELIAAPILSRITAVFALANAGNVPDDLVNAISDLATASVPTKLGLARTWFTPKSDTSYNTQFELQLDVP